MEGGRAWRLAAAALWVRAALRVPVLVLVLFYVFHDIEIGGRSSGFPDGALFLWLHLMASEVDSVVLVSVEWLVAGGVGRATMAIWLAGYVGVTVGYVLVGRRLWRAGPVGRRAHRALVTYLVLALCVHALTLFVVVPGAIDGVRTGENAPTYPYPGVALVHAYEWLLLPWALALPTVTVAAILWLRAGSRRPVAGSVP